MCHSDDASAHGDDLSKLGDDVSRNSDEISTQRDDIPPLGDDVSQVIRKSLRLPGASAGRETTRSTSARSVSDGGGAVWDDLIAKLLKRVQLRACCNTHLHAHTHT